MKYALILSLCFLFILGCDKDEETIIDNSPKNEKEYVGTSDENKTCSLKKADVNGVQMVTGYEIAFTYPFGGGIATETLKKYNSAGLALINNNSFDIAVNNGGTFGHIWGTVISDSINGAFNIKVVTVSTETLTVAQNFKLIKK